MIQILCHTTVSSPVVKNQLKNKNMGLLLRRCSGKGLHLSMTGEPRGFSRVTAGFSSYDGGSEKMIDVIPSSAPCSQVGHASEGLGIT